MRTNNTSSMCRLIIALLVVFTASILSYAQTKTGAQDDRSKDLSAPPITKNTSAIPAGTQERKVVVSGTVLDKDGKPLPNVVVQLTNYGCKSGNCPADLPCSSSCCDCSSLPCKCCVDQRAVTDIKGNYVLSYSSADSYVDVRYMIEGSSKGHFVAVELDRRDKKVILNALIDDGPKLNQRFQ